MSNKTTTHGTQSVHTNITASTQSYKLPYSDFYKGIQAVSRYFHDIAQGCRHFENNVPANCLHNWVIDENAHEPFLDHPTILHRLTYANVTSSVRDPYIDEEWDEYEDNNVEVEGSDIVTACESEETLEFDDIEWSFSIVYSHVWSMPIAYFQLHRQDGSFMTRKQVLKILNNTQQGYNRDNARSERNTDEEEERGQWNFVSQDEHPITGRPSYFFHPCQTSARMNLIYPDKNIMSSNPGKWILTWMSMILPSAGFRISPEILKGFDQCPR